MGKLRHIALATAPPGQVAECSKAVFGMDEIRRDPKGQVFLSDGVINMAILNFKTDDDPDVGAQGPNFSGIHHFGFYVDDVETYAEKVEEAGGERLTRTATPGTGGLFGADTSMGQGASNAEVKFRGPDGVIIDMSESGWQGITL